MAETTNTVKIGLDNWEVAKLDESDRVTGQPMRIPGLTSAQLALTFNTGTFQADDALWAILDGGISGLALTIGNADIKSEHKAVLHGIELEDGMEVYTADRNIPYTAHIFRSRLNTGQFVWFGLVKGKFMPGGVDLNTRAETPTGQPDSVVGNFEPRNDGITHIIARADSPDFDLAKFRQKVFRGITIPTA